MGDLCTVYDIELSMKMVEKVKTVEVYMYIVTDIELTLQIC